ncbi:phage tail spike protein [Paenibacillus popilliae]|uniref:phage tail spike protein n=1 Tax=Paenibacillus popilliae TaxID=78057 RepID=UPI0021AF3F81|nr:phage tail spike protein [Paenibacillus sp. SDF0028]
MRQLLGDIDWQRKPDKPQYFIAKPNREIIAKLSEAYDDHIRRKLNDVDELELSVPYKLDVNHLWIDNRNIELLKERYLIKVVHQNQTEWFIINEISESVGSDKESKTIKCYSAAHELTDKAIRMYEAESYHAEQVLTDLLKNTIWSIDYVDADFKLTYRAFEFPNTNVLSAVLSVAETYNAIVHFDTDKRMISMTKPELTGINRGLTFSYGKYMKTLGKNIKTDEMVTRLSATGHDGLGIQRVNPTGQNYIENFGFFMYPFERDQQKQVLSSSYHMSDSLCHALKDYEALVESKRGQFDALLKERKSLELQLGSLEVELDRLKNNEVVVTDRVISQQFDQKMFFERYHHSGSSSRSFTLNPIYPYAILAKIDNAQGVNIQINGTSVSSSSGKWVLLHKVKGDDQVTISFDGGTSSVFLQIASITLDEWNLAGADRDIVERYSLDNTENQIRLKQLEIDSVNRQLQAVQTKISELQATLAHDQNFTPEQLQELNLFVIEREFSDEKYIEEEDLYEAALEKFKELQQPSLSIDIDIVNFLEVIEEQHNWDKLKLGDFVNIKYEPTKTSVVARISEINYDFESSNIGIVLSNFKNVNDEASRIEKFLNESKNTSIIVDASKNKWGKAVVDTSSMSKLFDNFWDKITNQINMSINNTVDINNKGITITDPNDPLRFLRLTNGQVGLTRSGGLRYETAISADGVIAEMVLGKIILGQRVVIGDTTGVFTIEGSRLMIDDRCGREVVKLGLLSQTPDRFGFYLNRYASKDCGDTSIMNRVSMTADDGFVIERKRNGGFQKTLYTTLDGDLMFIGDLQVGEDEKVFKVNKQQGLSLGASTWSAAPFRADMYGNVWMNKLFADDAQIKNSFFKNGEIEGSKLTLRDGGGIMKMYPQTGFWAGAEEAKDAPVWIKMDGTAIVKKLIVTDTNNTLLMDSENKKIFMNQWDVIGAGAIDAGLIAANIITSQDGFISDLTAGRLSTLTNVAKNEWTNYIRVEGNSIKFITGKVKDGSEKHKTLEDGRYLYWKNPDQKGQMTIEKTNYPVMEYEMDEKIKQEISFDGTGDMAEPRRFIGLGDGSPNDGGRAIERKYRGGYELKYGASNTGRERSINLSDQGIFLKVESGGAKISHNSGSFIEITSDGAIHIKSTKDMKFESAGNMKFIAPRIDLN